ncbi:MAG: carboxypeptidase regulatory-like domain-containing protein, partial [Planctomycetaceae bacterium]|nr:carboxypeptidase regulatory-like domain-containing protein [Planctomycetaceae bacterium]
MRTTLGFSLAGCCLLWLAGCGVAPSPNYAKVNLLSVSGAVTLDGNPLPEAVVTFDSEDGQFSYGLTDSGGRFSLRFDSVKSGATPGKKTVRISTTRKILGLNTEEEGGGEEGSSEVAASKTTA